MEASQNIYFHAGKLLGLLHNVHDSWMGTACDCNESFRRSNYERLLLDRDAKLPVVPHCYKSLGHLSSKSFSQTIISFLGCFIGFLFVDVLVNKMFLTLKRGEIFVQVMDDAISFQGCA
jgi:hypothetical protein